MFDFLIDTHCHLNLGHLKNNVPKYVENARLQGVRYLHTICTKLEEFPDIASITDACDNVYCSVGVHPCNVNKENMVLAESLIDLSKNEKVISYGETGLDYYHDGFDVSAQKESFLNHIKASQITKLPIIIHTRNAKDDTLDILKSEMKNENFSGIIHCFTEDYDFAKQALDLGMYISIAGIVTFKNAKLLQDVVLKLPLDRILVETDAPYLAPMPYRGKPNEPAYVSYTAIFLANMFNISLQDFISITSSNAARILAKGKFAGNV
ncbi:MAG: TatD family hydrolase [Rickettsiaceae bacterium]|nr:TatD family hydrolase [Rickettsiaceae bacterium]